MPARAPRLKVAHLTTVDMSLWHLLLAQLRAVRDAGGEAIGISAPGPYVAALEREGIRHIAIESSTRAMDPRADVSAARQLYRILRRERIDVLHTHNPKPGAYGRIVGRWARVPIVANTVHGLYATDHDPWLRRAAVYGVEAIAARCSDVELIQNPEDFALMQRLHLTRNARVLGNGVDLERFDPSRFTTEQRRRARAELGARDDTVVVGTVGRLVAEKGYAELFDAFATLDPHRYLLVVAGGEDNAKADALPRSSLDAARERGVVFLGHRDDIELVYATLDVFVLPSHREGFPRAAMEAQAMAVPVVASNIRGCRQVVDDGRTGLLVAPREAPALANAIAQLGDDEPRRSAMRAAARTRAQAEFDERRVVERVLRAYIDVSRRKGLGLDLLVHPS